MTEPVDERLAAALDALTPGDRAFFHMWAVRGLEDQQIAILMGPRTGSLPERRERVIAQLSTTLEITPEAAVALIAGLRAPGGAPTVARRPRRSPATAARTVRSPATAARTPRSPATAARTPPAPAPPAPRAAASSQPAGTAPGPRRRPLAVIVLLLVVVLAVTVLVTQRLHHSAHPRREASPSSQLSTSK